MGYTTYFSGKFDLDRPLTAGHLAFLNEFAETRQSALAGQLSYYCQWVPTQDGKSIVWDGEEKFYAYEGWIKFLVVSFLEPWGYRLNGTVEWCGEDADDRGQLVMVDNRLTVKHARVVFE